MKKREAWYICTPAISKAGGRAGRGVQTPPPSLPKQCRIHDAVKAQKKINAPSSNPVCVQKTTRRACAPHPPLCILCNLTHRPPLPFTGGGALIEHAVDPSNYNDPGFDAKIKSMAQVGCLVLFTIKLQNRSNTILSPEKNKGTERMLRRPCAPLPCTRGAEWSRWSEGASVRPQKINVGGPALTRADDIASPPPPHPPLSYHSQRMLPAPSFGRRFRKLAQIGTTSCFKSSLGITFHSSP